MEITLKNIAPIPMVGAFSLQGEIWEKTVVFSSGAKIQIHAPSGSGKTTFTHILLGLRSDYTGELTFDQNSLGLHDQKWATLRREKLAVVFQDLRLFPNETAWDNVVLKNQLTQHKTKAEIEGYFEALGILRLKDKTCKTLSRGEQQRVAIIRAICQPFAWVLLDEPFSHLDPDNAKKAAELIQSRIQEEGAGMLMLNLYEDTFFNYDQKLRLA